MRQDGGTCRCKQQAAIHSADQERKLDATFPLWSPNAEELIREPKDIAFLASMKGDRVATFGAFDAKLQSKVKRRQERECVFAARQARVTKVQQGMTATTSMVMMESENDEGRR